MSNPFGWSYPPGAANDPNAPWNQKEIEAECYICWKNAVECDMTDEEIDSVFWDDELGKNVYLCDSCLGIENE